MYERLEKKAKHAYAVAVAHQHRLGFFAFIFGFLFDVLTLRDIGKTFEQASFTLYMVLGTVLLVWISLKERGGQHVAHVAFTALQFVFGALAGGFLVLYGRSGTFVGSVFFISGVVLLLASNELLREQYRRVPFRFLMWFVLLTVYTTLFLPLMYGRLGFDVFTHAIITAATIGMGLLIFFRTTKVFVRAFDFYVGVLTMVLTACLFWISYYTHSIPPVPLSLQRAFIAYDVVPLGSGDAKTYTVSYAPSAWSWVTSVLPLGNEASSTFLAPPSEEVTWMYCWSLVYAPAVMKSKLQHRWEVYNTEAEAWQSIVIVPVPIAGGRPQGYRAYSAIKMYPRDVLRGYGTYRCNIEIEEGALLGRRTVTVEPGQPTPKTAVY